MQQDKGFKVGDIVKFKIESLYIKDYYTSALDKCNQKYIKHGSPTIKENKGTIKYIDTNYFYIEYIDEKDKKVCLGFKSDSFELLEPKQEQYYTSIPTDVKVGDKFEVINGKGLQTNTTFPYYGVSIGSIVTLKKYRRELTFSDFTNDKNETWSYDWGWLKPVKVVTNSHLVDVSPTVLFGRDSLSNTDIQKFKVGDEVEVTNSNYPVIMYVSNGTIGKIITIEASGILVQFDKCRQLCKATQLKLINKTNHNYGKVQNNSMSFSTTSYKITRGETICSSAIRCSKSKIQI